MKDHEIAQMKTQLSAYESDLKEKEKTIDDMETVYAWQTRKPVKWR